MTINIAHLADIHTKNSNILDIQYVLQKLIQQLDIYKPEIITIVGDLVHTKSQLFPEQINTAKTFVYDLNDLSYIKKIIINIGNHDININNLEQCNSIEAIFKESLSQHYTSDFTSQIYDNSRYSGLYSGKIIVLNHSDVYPYIKDDKSIVFANYSILDDSKIYDKLNNIVENNFDDNVFKIALYHGMFFNSNIKSIKLNEKFEKKSTSKNYVNLNTKLYHAIMLGDIHQYMELSSKIVYPGSLIQNNFGEENDKGFVLWNVDLDNNKCEHKRIILPSRTQYFTFAKLDDVDDNLDMLKNIDKPKIRIISENDISTKDKQNIKSKLPQAVLYTIKNKDICNRVKTSLENTQLEVENKNHNIENKYFDDLLNNLKQDSKFKDDLSNYHKYNKILKYHNFLSKKLLDNINQQTLYNNEYDFEYLECEGIYSYKKKMVLNFSEFPINSLIGVFGKNFSGKSNIFSILFYAMYGQSLYTSIKNSDILNDNSKLGYTVIILNSINHNKKYLIYRTLSKSGKSVSSSAMIFEFPFTDSNETILSILPLLKNKENLEAYSTNNLTLDDKNQTENLIQKLLGSSDVFMLINYASQTNLDYFISKMKNKDRKDLIKQIFGIDISKLSDYVSKQYNSKNNNLTYNKNNLSQILQQYNVESYDKAILQCENLIKEKKNRIKEIENLLLQCKVVKVDDPSDYKYKDDKQYDDEIQRLSVIIDNLKKQPIKIDGEFNKLYKFIGTLESQLSSLQKLKTQSIKDMNSFEKIKTKCVLQLECDYYQNGSNMHKQYKDSIEKETTIQKQLQQIKEILKHSETINKNESDLDNIKNEYKKFKVANFDDNDNKNYDRYNNEKSRLLIDIGKIEQNIQNINNMVKLISRQEKKFDVLSIYYSIIKLLPDFIMTQLINNLENKINSSLLTLAEDLQIKFYVTGSTVELMFIMNKKEKSIYLASGMQKTLISFAIRNAFAELIKENFTLSSDLSYYSIIIFDESFSMIDNENLVSLFMLFEMIKIKYKNIFLISHDEYAQDVVDNSIQVQYDNKLQSSIISTT